MSTQLSKNLIFHYADTLSSNYLPMADKGVWYIRFHFTFHGEDYVADVHSDKVKEDWESVEAEGPSELFDSFISALEDTYWEELVKLFHEHVAYELSQLEPSEGGVES